MKWLDLSLKGHAQLDSTLYIALSAFIGNSNILNSKLHFILPLERNRGVWKAYLFFWGNVRVFICNLETFVDRCMKLWDYLLRKPFDSSLINRLACLVCWVPTLLLNVALIWILNFIFYIQWRMGEIRSVNGTSRNNSLNVSFM